MSEQPKWTPGPWRFEPHAPHFDFYGNIIGSYGIGKNGFEEIRSITCQLRHGPREEMKANAQLIAAAPDMYEALRGLHDSIAEYARINNLGGFDNQDMKQARAALAKARGEQ